MRQQAQGRKVVTIIISIPACAKFESASINQLVPATKDICVGATHVLHANSAATSHH